MNWEKAEQHLHACENAYAGIGSAGYFVLILTIRPLRDRYNKGERSEDLYNEIMGIVL